MNDSDKRALIGNIHNALHPETPVVDDAWPCYHSPDSDDLSTSACDEMTGARPPLQEFGGRVVGFPWPVYIKGDYPSGPRLVSRPETVNEIPWYSTYHYQPVPDYLSWAGLALMVEAMRERGWDCLFTMIDDSWCASFSKGWKLSDPCGTARGDTLPEAVARAMLAALGGGEPNV